MLKEETKFWHEIRNHKSEISWTRLENSAAHGTPDLLGYSPLGNFFTLELKVAKSNKVQLSPHQVSFHVKHKTNTYVLVACDPKLGSYRLYPGHRILELVDSGLKLEPLCAGWEACRLKLESL